MRAAVIHEHIFTYGNGHFTLFNAQNHFFFHRFIVVRIRRRKDRRRRERGRRGHHRVFVLPRPNALRNVLKADARKRITVYDSRIFHDLGRDVKPCLIHRQNPLDHFHVEVGICYAEIELVLARANYLRLDYVNAHKRNQFLAKLRSVFVQSLIAYGWNRFAHVDFVFTYNAEFYVFFIDDERAFPLTLVVFVVDDDGKIVATHVHRVVPIIGNIHYFYVIHIHAVKGIARRMHTAVVNKLRDGILKFQSLFVNAQSYGIRCVYRILLIV